MFNYFSLKNQSVFCFRAQIDEIQKKQDKLNAFKNRKLYSGTGNANSREMGGESPTRRPLPTIKSNRSSSMSRPMKRLTAVSFLFRCFSLLPLN
jgi:hypothetical protein